MERVKVEFIMDVDDGFYESMQRWDYRLEDFLDLTGLPMWKQIRSIHDTKIIKEEVGVEDNTSIISKRRLFNIIEESSCIAIVEKKSEPTNPFNVFSLKMILKRRNPYKVPSSIRLMIASDRDEKARVTGIDIIACLFHPQRDYLSRSFAVRKIGMFFGFFVVEVSGFTEHNWHHLQPWIRRIVKPAELGLSKGEKLSGKAALNVMVDAIESGDCVVLGDSLKVPIYDGFRSEFPSLSEDIRDNLKTLSTMEEKESCIFDFLGRYNESQRDFYYKRYQLFTDDQKKEFIREIERDGLIIVIKQSGN